MEKKDKAFGLHDLRPSEGSKKKSSSGSGVSMRRNANSPCDDGSASIMPFSCECTKPA